MATNKKRISPMGWVILIVLAALGLGMAVLFGYQTWELVNWVLPSEAMLMKILAVLAFDGFSYLWLAASRFLKYQLRRGAKGWCQVTGVIDLVLSLICSIIQMNISEAERYVYQIDIHLVYLANIIIVAAVVLNLVTLLAVVHIQFPDNTEEEAPVQQHSVQVQSPYMPLTAEERQRMIEATQQLYLQEMQKLMQPRTTVQEVAAAEQASAGQEQASQPAPMQQSYQPPAPPVSVTPVSQPPVPAPAAQTYRFEDVQAALKRAYDEGAASARTPVPPTEVTGKLEAVKPPDPLATSPLPAQASQQGSQNGHQ